MDPPDAGDDESTGDDSPSTDHGTSDDDAAPADDPDDGSAPDAPGPDDAPADGARPDAPPVDSGGEEAPDDRTPGTGPRDDEAAGVGEGGDDAAGVEAAGDEAIRDHAPGDDPAGQPHDPTDVGGQPRAGGPPTGSGDEAARSVGDQAPGGAPDETGSGATRPAAVDGPAGSRTRDAPAASVREADQSMDWRAFVSDVVSSAGAVLLVGVLLFAVSGVWPPMVAVESPSMTPHMHTGDLVFVMEAERFPGEGAHAGTGVVTARTGRTTDADYRKFGMQGDVIVYNPDGNRGTTPIIHRAMFWVNESENWYDKADRQSVGRYSECGNSTDEALPNCPAPHAGFVTKGDANAVYDQAQGLSAPVRPSWIVGTAELRIPVLGCIRLRTEGCIGNTFSSGDVRAAAGAAASEPAVGNVTAPA